MRTSWNMFPPIVRNADLGTLKADGRYDAAKSGDWEAALALVAGQVTDDYFQSLEDMIGNNEVIVLPVLAHERTGRNKIPLAAATIISEMLGQEVSTSIGQAEYVGRTGKGIDHRFAFQPTFTGDVRNDVPYLIIDDTLSVGGTIAQLRGYIETNGGKVVGASALTAHPGCLNLRVTEKMLRSITAKHGDAMDEFWNEEFGYGLHCLTQQEAGHIRAAASVDAMRDRILAARNDGRPAQNAGLLEIDPLAAAPQVTSELKV